MSALVGLGVLLLVGVIVCEHARIGRFGDRWYLVAVLSIFFFAGPLIRAHEPNPILSVAFVVYAAILFAFTWHRLGREGPAPWE